MKEGKKEAERELKKTKAILARSHKTQQEKAQKKSSEANKKIISDASKKAAKVKKPSAKKTSAKKPLQIPQKSKNHYLHKIKFLMLMTEFV